MWQLINREYGLYVSPQLMVLPTTILPKMIETEFFSFPNLQCVISQNIWFCFLGFCSFDMGQKYEL